MEKGISTAQAHELQKIHGQNVIQTKQTFSPIKLFLSQFPSVINGILLLATLFSFFLGEKLDGTFILTIILLNALFGFIQEYKAEKSLEKLRSYITQTVRVFRNGSEKQIDASDIVPGDTVILSEGDRIPADGKILEVTNLEIDESILTGEALPVRKNKDDTVFLGTLIAKGKGLLLIEKIGMQTRFGQIALSLATIKVDKTPLQKQLSSLGKLLSAVAVVTAFLLLPIGIAQGRELSSLVLIAVSIGVAAVPEGLPAVITIALAIGTSRMAKRNAIIRQMPAVETLGAVQIFLVDKTGTLTENEMRVKKTWSPEKTEQDHLLSACILGNTASLVQKTNLNEFDIVGDKTDGALLLFAKQQNPELEKTLKDGRIRDEFVFDSTTRTVTTIWENKDKHYVFVRGAPEAILEKSRFSVTERQKAEKEFISLANEGLRVIAFGSKEGHFSSRLNRDEHEKDLTFLGFIGIYDPPRAQVHQAISQAQQAGIRTIMVTGDNEITALSIAKEIGLVKNNEDVVTGEELEKLTDDELLRLLPNTTIFARSRPQDKLRLTTLFKQQGYVVGVTGDGVNDALALKKANVGVAMGISGTDVAKEASDIIITDDNFATIMKAIEEGRIIYHNIVTSIKYLLTSNLSEIALVLFSTLLGMPTALLPTQILWINIATDGLPALALATDSHHSNMLHQKPRDPKLPILTKSRLLFVVIVGLSLTLVLLSVYTFFLRTSGELIARTIVFHLLVISHMALAFIVRGKNAFRPNKFLVFTVLITLLLQSIIAFTPFFHEIFEITFPF